MRQRLRREPEFRAKVVHDIRSGIPGWTSFYANAGSPERILLVGFKQEAMKRFQGKTLASVARERGKDPIETLLDLLIEDDSGIGTLYFITSADNVRKLVPLPWVSSGRTRRRRRRRECS